MPMLLPSPQTWLNSLNALVELVTKMRLWTEHHNVNNREGEMLQGINKLSTRHIVPVGPFWKIVYVAWKNNEVSCIHFEQQL